MKEKDRLRVLLTLKDLKELGLIGKKKKRRNKRKLLKNIAKQQEQQYNLNTLNKSTTIQTDNNNMKNEVENIRNKVFNDGIINNTNSQSNNLILNDLQKQHNYLQDATISGFQHFNNKTRFLNDKPDEPSRFQSVSQNIFADTTDGIDNPTTEGSDGFLKDGNNKPEFEDPTSDFSSQSDYNPSVENEYFKYSTPIDNHKNINEDDLETDKSVINSPNIYLNQTESDLIPNKKGKGVRYANLLEVQHQAQNLGITDLTPNVGALKKLITEKTKLNNLKTQYAGLANEPYYLESNSINEVKEEIKRLEREKKNKLNKFIKPK